LRIKDVFSSSVTLEWDRNTDWDGPNLPHIIIPDNLRLTYYKSELEKVELELPISDTAVILNNLDPDWNYTIELRAVYRRVNITEI